MTGHHAIAALALCLSLHSTDAATGNAGNPRDRPEGTIVVIDSGWSTSTSTSDCVTGNGADTWQLTLSEQKSVTVSAFDLYCPGDFYEVYVNGTLVGTTPNLAPPWGCDFQGPLSTGSFTVGLCAGTHTITVRDAGFDGHSSDEIAAQGMCPAGFTVSGVLSPYSSVLARSSDTRSERVKLTPEVQSLEGAFEQISPYVKVLGDGSLVLDVDAARKVDVSQDAMRLGDALVALNNQIVVEARGNGPSRLSPEDFAFIDPLLRYWASNPDGVLDVQCGNFRNPTACPQRVESNSCFASRNDVIHHLVSLGYHRTADYAGGRNGNDYTLALVDPHCGVGVFRTQALVEDKAGSWSYNTQGPEPNPEIFTYVWPDLSPFWPIYVRWWHLTYC